MKNGLIINKYGHKYWYKDNLRHREDGPAVEYYNGDKYWYYQGQIIVCKTQQQFEKLIKLRIFW